MAARARRMQAWLARGWKKQRGQGLVEYALILLLASIVAIAALTDLGVTITTKLYTLGGSF